MIEAIPMIKGMPKYISKALPLIHRVTKCLNKFTNSQHTIMKFADHQFSMLKYHAYPFFWSENSTLWNKWWTIQTTTTGLTTTTTPSSSSAQRSTGLPMSTSDRWVNIGFFYRVWDFLTYKIVSFELGYWSIDSCS